MIAHSEHYIIIVREEIGPEVRRLIDIQRQCGCATLSGNGAWTIKCASEEDQKVWFAAFERAMDEDFPPPCDECGSSADECSCDAEEKANTEGKGVGRG